MRGDMLGVDRFGASAPAEVLLEKYGFTVDNVVARRASCSIAESALPMVKPNPRSVCEDESLLGADAARPAARFLRLLRPRGQPRPTGWCSTRPRRTGRPASPRSAWRSPAIRSASSAASSRAPRPPQRTLTTLRFFADSEQGEAPDATGYKRLLLPLPRHGDRPARLALRAVDHRHRAPVAGVLAAAAYFDGATADEAEIRALAGALRARRLGLVLGGGGTIVPRLEARRAGFLPYRWEGYDEALILYVLALGSPTHPIEPRRYDAWCRDLPVEDGLRHRATSTPGRCSSTSSRTSGSTSAASRTPSCASAAATTSRTAGARRWCSSSTRSAIRSASRDYGELCWGITASDGPGTGDDGDRRRRAASSSTTSRAACPYGPDDGTIAPWAVVASLPFAPEIVLPTIAQLPAHAARGAESLRLQGVVQPDLRRPTPAPVGWVSPYHFGINEGPTVLMIENYRSGLLWKLMRRCAPLRRGLARAGFAGGWLVGSTNCRCL